MSDISELIAKDIVTGPDGYKVYWPAPYHGGAYTAHALRAIADELDRLNAEWDASVNNFFNTKQPQQDEAND